eukprot:COSAG02_NODE_8635_length_2497_cov_2.471030_4_plen_117_part_01
MVFVAAGSGAAGSGAAGSGAAGTPVGVSSAHCAHSAQMTPLLFGSSRFACSRAAFQSDCHCLPLGCMFFLQPKQHFSVSYDSGFRPNLGSSFFFPFPSPSTTGASMNPLHSVCVPPL